MRLMSFTEGRIQARARKRPPEYLAELEAVRIKVDGDWWVFDADDPRYQAIVRKYENYIPPPKPPPPAPRPARVWEDRPAPTAGQVASFAVAAVTGKYVRQSLVVLRDRVCGQPCEWARQDAQGDWCGACGCGTSADDRKLRNLAAYEERLPGYGCKHPARGTAGKGWPVDCQHWQPSGTPGIGLCAIGLHGGRPHVAICAGGACPSRVELVLPEPEEAAT